MEKSKAKKIRDIARDRNCAISPLPPYSTARVNDLYAEFKALLIKNIEVEGLDYEAEAFMLNELIDTNIIGFDKLIGRFMRAYGNGVFNEYYNATKATFILPYRSYERKLSYDANPWGAYLIKGLPAGISFYSILMRYCQRIADADSALYQNLQATRTPFIVVTRDDDIRLSVEQAIQQRQAGQPVIIASPDVGDALKGIPTVTDYLVDRLNEYEDSVRAKALNAISIVTANTEKRERVQVGEINAKIGECEDYIFTFIDNVNKQFKTYGIPFNLRLTASLNNYLDRIADELSGVSADGEIENEGV